MGVLFDTFGSSDELPFVVELKFSKPTHKVRRSRAPPRARRPHRLHTPGR